MPSILKQLNDELGFEPTFRLMAGWGGASLYVPDKHDDNHLLAIVIGVRAARILVEKFGGRSIRLPNPIRRVVIEVNTVKMLASGVSPMDAAPIVGISYDRVMQIANEYGLAGQAETKRADGVAGCVVLSQCETGAGVPGGKAAHGPADPRKTPSSRTRPVSYRPTKREAR
ncbi:MAG: hypothetical protein HGB02_08695 [Chlorobiaceae bacterium]|nr:hypothetical protein [Chlorobiaceae bacterium]